MEIAEDILGEAPDHAKKAWYDMRREFKLEPATLHPQVFMTFDDNWIEFSLRYVVDIRKRRITKDHLFTRLLDELEQHKGVIELASQTIEMVQDPTKPKVTFDA